jgi:hypothetical protein
LEQRATDFVEAMVIVAVIGVLAFLIGLLARVPQGRQAGVGGAVQPAQSPRWYEFTLALILLAAIAAFAIWLISSGQQWVWGETIGDWRSDTRTIIFAAVMVALGVIGLAISLAYALIQSSQSTATGRPPLDGTAETTPASAGIAPAPSPLRLLGLLGLALAVLLVCWIALSPVEQYALVAQLLYPASLGVSLVLLFDKATRTWGTKRGAETVREWLFCDLLVVLLVLAFLHLRNVAKPEAYASSFWDILNVILFFAAFWLIDRTASRSRFLVGYGYLVVLPLLVLIWDAVQNVAVAASWWGSVWPFLILTGVFFVLEVITLVTSTPERQTLPALREALFVVIYAILLIVAVKSHA